MEANCTYQLEGSFSRWLPLLGEFDETDLGLLMGTTCRVHREHQQVYAERNQDSSIQMESTVGTEVKWLKFIENIWRHRKAQLTLYGLSAISSSCSSSKCLTEIFKTRLDKVLCSLLWVTLLWQEGWTRWPTEVPSNPEHPVILWKKTNSSLFPLNQWCHCKSWTVTERNPSPLALKLPWIYLQWDEWQIKETIGQANTLYKYILFRDTHSNMHKYFLFTNFQITQPQVVEKTNCS